MIRFKKKELGSIFSRNQETAERKAIFKFPSCAEGMPREGDVKGGLKKAEHKSLNSSKENCNSSRWIE